MKTGQEERERLKEEYKAHYKRLKEAKEGLAAAEKKGKIVQALQNMDAGRLFDETDGFLEKLRTKVAMAEARLELALETFDTDEADPAPDRSSGGTRQQKAAETLKQVKAEMGILYSDIEKHAQELKTKKTIGPGKENEPPKEAG